LLRIVLHPLHLIKHIIDLYIFYLIIQFSDSLRDVNPNKIQFYKARIDQTFCNLRHQRGVLCGGRHGAIKDGVVYVQSTLTHQPNMADVNTDDVVKTFEDMRRSKEYEYIMCKLSSDGSTLNVDKVWVVSLDWEHTCGTNAHKVTWANGTDAHKVTMDRCKLIHSAVFLQ